MKKTLTHLPVLKDEILTEVVSADTKTVFDGTLGLGGHAEATLEKYPKLNAYIATDLDTEHLEFATGRLKKYAEKLSLHRANFAQLKECVPNGIERPLSIVLDLGLCSNQVDTAEKGFSFQEEGPLKMSFAGEKSAENLLNKSSEKDLTDIFRTFGEIKHAAKLAKAIVETRKSEPLTTTLQFREVIESATHPKERKKTVSLAFQAIRIAANEELEVLEKALDDACSIMQPNDRLGVISYHSLEDRIVKQKFKHVTQPVTTSDDYSLHAVISPAEFKLHTKKPIEPTENEIANNPRARSAKLRIIEKI